MPNKYFGDSQEALRMMIPLVVNQRNIEANARQWDQKLNILKQQAEADTLQKLQQQKQAEQDAKNKLVIEEYKRRLDAGDTEGLQQVAPQAEQIGVPVPKYFEGPTGRERYMGLPIKPKEDAYQLMQTDQGIVHVPKIPGRGQPIPTGLMPPQQKWQVFPPGSSEAGPNIAKTIDLGDRVRVFKKDGSYEDLPKNPTPTATEQSTRPPKGYRWNDNKELEAIPGGPADEKTQIKYAQERASYESTTSELDRLQDQTRQLMNHPGLSKITGLMGKIPNMPGSEASNAEAMLETLKSQTAFSVLQAMRNASKTGGALGQVSDKEGELLQNNLAALSKAQSYDAYRKSLQRIIDFTDNAKKRMGGVFNSTWKSMESQRQPQEWKKENLQLNTAEDYINKKFGGAR